MKAEGQRGLGRTLDTASETSSYGRHPGATAATCTSHVYVRRLILQTGPQLLIKSAFAKDLKNNMPCNPSQHTA